MVIEPSPADKSGRVLEYSEKCLFPLVVEVNEKRNTMDFTRNAEAFLKEPLLHATEIREKC